MKSFFFLCFIGLFLSFQSFGQDSKILERIEPPFWWTKMNDPHLQIMLYGDGISYLRPKITHEDVNLIRSIQVENPNYLFLELDLKDVIKETFFTIQLLEEDKVAESYEYSLHAREEGSSSRQGFDNSDVMYLITPDRFVNGDPSNDNVSGLKEKANRDFKGGRHGGDIAGMTKSLDYIKDMGFTAIWINPLLENDQPQYSYHGYSTTDFYRVDSRYGNNASYKAMCNTADSKGIKVIMDMILNHCGSEHWWMNDLPTSDWINFENKFQVTNHKRTTIQDLYASEYDKKYFSDGWFVKTMPDLNQRNPLFSTYLIQNTIWWIEYTGLSGIRMDTYPYPDMDFMTEWTRRVMEEYPNFNIVGEEWTVNPAIVSYWQKGKINHNGYKSYLPSLMDFPVQHALVQALNEDESWSDGWIKLYEMLANDFLYPDPYNLVIFPDNHDMSRFFTQVNEDLDLYKLGLAYLLTTRGIPQIYYGTEILMKNPEGRDHGIIRSDFPGGWPGDDINAFTDTGLTEDQAEAKAYLKKLLNWRKHNSTIHSGQLKHFAPFDGVYIFFRYDADQTVMIILNKSMEEVELQYQRFGEVLKGLKSGKDIITEKEYKFKDDILRIPPKTPLILEMF